MDLAVAALRASGSGDNANCNGTAYPWANKYLGECVMDGKQLAALILGLSSILFWMVAQGP
jgi:hypothetical protein